MQDSLIGALKALYTRDLNKLKNELSAYKTESNIWILDKEIPNSAGNLALHLVGNLRAFIGAEIGKTGYIRKREEEFSLKGVPREDILAEIDLTITEINQALDQLTTEDLKGEYPLKIFKEKMHLGYHLGQLNYHRRLLD